MTRGTFRATIGVWALAGLAYASLSCSTSPPSSSAGGSSCQAAGGTCVLGNATCARQAASNVQDCNPPPGGGGASCCLALGDGGGTSLDDGSSDGGAVVVPPTDGAAPYTAPPPGCDVPDAGTGCGWLCGDGVSATICDVAGTAYTRDSILASEGVGPATLLELGTAGVVISFQEPATASDGSLIGYIAVNAAAGVYTSGEAIGCTDFSVSYYLPVPASVDCADASGPSCPPGCSSACSGFGCGPCAPNPPSILYGAQTVDPLCNGSSNEPPTDGGERPGAGSWTVTLTAVEPAGTSSGATAYTVHGTLSAQLVGEGPDGGTIGSAALFLVF